MHGKKCKEPYIPPQQGKNAGRKTLVLDLDETLVHSFHRPIANANFKFSVIHAEESRLTWRDRRLRFTCL